LLLLGVLGVAALTLALHPQVAFAQGGVDDKNGPFQLEGNATKDGTICFRPANADTSNPAPSWTFPNNLGNCPSTFFTKLTFGANTDDWANLNTSLGGAHALAKTGLIDDLTNSQSDTIFTGGGSKDINDIGQWLWKTAKVGQPKDDIAHTYAAAYSLTNGHTAIYFGLDRFSNAGDATAGFWFLQDSTISLNGGPGGGGTHFTGHHMDGDLLIVSDFSTGGAVSTIEVFLWSGGANGSLTGPIQTLTTNATCNPVIGTSALCSIVNPVNPVDAPSNQDVGITSPWSFTNSKGTSVFFAGEFLEGGIDLQSIFGNNVPCFTTFLAETRASTSGSATLSDFSGPHSFPLCGITLTKTCNPTNGAVASDGSSVKYGFSGTVTNSGIGTLFDVDVTDTLPDGSTKTIHVVGPSLPANGPCGANPCPSSLPASGQVNFTIADINTSPFEATSTNCKTGVANCASPLDVTNTATAKAASSEGGSQSIVFPAEGGLPASAECTASVSSGVSVTKQCDADNGGATLVERNGLVQVKVFVKGQVCNEGTTALSGVTLADTPSATISLVSSSLAPKGQTGDCANYTANYFPSTISSSGVAGRFLFSDTISVTSATPALGPPLSPAPAAAACPNATDLACKPVSCPICPAGVCIQ